MGIKWSHSPETISKIKLAIASRSDDRKKEIANKISVAKKGMVGPTLGYRWTKAQKEKFSLQRKGQKQSPEAIEKMRQTKIGKKATLETRKKMSGKIPWNWKGGADVIQKKIRRLPEYKQWRISLYIRDRHKCVRCGKKDIKENRLVAHHRYKGFAKILEENNIKSVEDAIKCSELWDIDNGEIVCIKCHEEIHFGIIIKN